MTHPEAPPLPLLDRVRAALRTCHCSLRTEKAYVGWIRRYILFHGKRHPAEMGADEITRFLSDLAIQRHVVASTQNQALSALLFLYREVLEQELPWLDEIVRAKSRERIPVVLTREEVRTVIASVPRDHRKIRATPCAAAEGRKVTKLSLSPRVRAVRESRRPFQRFRTSPCGTAHGLGRDSTLAPPRDGVERARRGCRHVPGATQQARVRHLPVVNQDAPRLAARGRTAAAGPGGGATV